eukprot:TRINITY_DN23309_c0_g1_i1.p1 TRINITY_DN23309_c0_g1~~TRINITY_DN23309_c0_g1_i1.p1  ORF type:complete len:459 (+),score=89.32 TRINITY_DN23309_c0_g1_i1:113-1489(+)
MEWSYRRLCLLLVICALQPTDLKRTAGRQQAAFEVTEIAPTSLHTASVILLHGFGDSSESWSGLIRAVHQTGDKSSGVRWLCLDAPKRGSRNDEGPAWFEYITNRGGEMEEDEINEQQLFEVRQELHALIRREMERLRHRGGPRQVMLVGFSQGGSTALDAALTLPGARPLGGVAMLRSLALGVTARDAAVLASRPGHPRPKTPVLVVSAEEDDVFLLPLVGQQLKQVRAHVDLVHREVIPGLDHVTEHPRETARVAAFVVQRLGLSGSSMVVDEQSLEKELQARLPARLRGWDELSDDERLSALMLGCKTQEDWEMSWSGAMMKYWEELSPLEKGAAEKLGWDGDTWDDEYEDDEDDDEEDEDEEDASISAHSDFLISRSSNPMQHARTPPSRRVRMRHRLRGKTWVTWTGMNGEASQDAVPTFFMDDAPENTAPEQGIVEQPPLKRIKVKADVDSP